MPDMDFYRTLVQPSEHKMLLVVIDGLGGAPLEPNGLSELESARTPHLDALARNGICGLLDPVAPGVTPGSGPAHLALFGYDPIRYQIGRGVLSALGVDLELQHGDVPARINFCTLDSEGRVTDRRAGRIDTELNRRLIDKLTRSIRIPDVQVILKTEKEHRAAVIFRGANLHGDLTDSDPQHTGVPPNPVRANNPRAERTAQIANEFIRQAHEILKNEHPANGILMRGFDRYEGLPKMSEIYQLRCAAIATYPMYRGVARLVGMDVLPTGPDVQDELETLRKNLPQYDYFYLHIKHTDECGEDGDFQGKVKTIEQIDRDLAPLASMDITVIAITGDHSTPSLLKAHSWHPVPVLLWSPFCRPDTVNRFSETACLSGGLGRIPSMHLFPLMLANALRLKKFGA